MPDNRIRRYLDLLPKEQAKEIAQNLDYDFPLLNPCRCSDEKFKLASSKTLFRLAKIIGVPSALDFFLSSEWNFKKFLEAKQNEINEQRVAEPY